MSTFDQPGWSFDQSGATFGGAISAPLWLSISINPPLHLYRDSSAVAFIPPGERAVQILRAVGELQAEIEGIVPSLAVTLDNASGQAADVMHAAPPLLSTASLYRGSELLYSGIVHGIKLDVEAQIEVRS